MTSHAGFRGKPRLRRSFALPAPGFPLALSPKLALMLGMRGVQNLRLVFLARSRRVAATSFARSEFPPSVTSVASVRCFLPRGVFLARAAGRVGR